MVGTKPQRQADSRGGVKVRARRKAVFGHKLSESYLQEITRRVAGEAVPSGQGLRLLVTMNLDHVVTLRRNKEFQAAYRSAWIVTADGTPVYLYARARGLRIPGRVTGADLFPEILEQLSAGLHRPFFVASSEETAAQIRAALKKKGFSMRDFDTVVPPSGFERDTTNSEAIAKRIRRLRTTHLFFGLGAPKSEIWMHQHREELGDIYGFAFGAGLDFFAGTAKRAPRIMQRSGLEWLWRFSQQPRRLFRRYFIDSWLFLSAIADDLRGKYAVEVASPNHR